MDGADSDSWMKKGDLEILVRCLPQNDPRKGNDDDMIGPRHNCGVKRWTRSGLAATMLFETMIVWEMSWSAWCGDRS